MKNILRLVLLAAAVAVGVWLWTIFFPSPEKIIRRRLAEVARNVSFTSGGNQMAELARAQKLAGFFSASLEVNIEAPRRLQYTFADRSEIMRAVAAAHESAGGLKVEFLDVSVEVGPDRQTAVADLTVRAQVAGDKDFSVQAMRFTFKKTDGEWLITRVETVRTLS